MHIKELSIHEFENFVDKSGFGSHYQTYEYAALMKDNGFSFEMIGLVDENANIHAASLILIKKLTKLFKYGYAPKGFIIDYTDKKLLKEFTDKVISYYKKKLVFIKINPEVAIAEININNFKKTYNDNAQIIKSLLDLGYVKLKDNLYFESTLPKYNGIVNLKKFSLDHLDKNTRNKIKRGASKGINNHEY